MDLFRFGKAAKQPPLLLIVDRREDPVTPLLNQWTYTAMIHEILGIHNNRVDMPADQVPRPLLSASPVLQPVKVILSSSQLQPCSSADATASSPQDAVVLNVSDDDFFRDAEHMEFGELGESLQKAMVALQQDEGTAVASGAGRDRMQSIGDIQRFMDRYPEFRKQQSTMAKHVALTSELSRSRVCASWLSLCLHQCLSVSVCACACACAVCMYVCVTFRVCVCLSVSSLGCAECVRAVCSSRRRKLRTRCSAPPQRHHRPALRCTMHLSAVNAGAGWG